MNFDAEGFAKAVKTHRLINLNIGLREVAKKTKISAATLSRIENGRATDIDNVVKLCDWMDMPLAYFLIMNKKNKNEKPK